MMTSYEETQRQIAEAVKRFPATFKLRAFPGDIFRVSASSSYINDSGTLTLYTEVLRGDQWLSFAKGTEQELQKEIVREYVPPPQRNYSQTVKGEARAAIVSAELTRRSQSFRLMPLPDDQWEFTVKIENEIELGRIAREQSSVALLERYAGTENEAEAAAEVLKHAADHLYDAIGDCPEEYTNAGDSNAIDLLDAKRFKLQPVTDVCIAGAPAVNGVCGNAECVCAPATEPRYVDLTPRGCTTPEGNARVNAALKAFEDSAAELANATMRFFDEHEATILGALKFARNQGRHDDDSGDLRDDLRDLKALIEARRAAQEEFLRALAGAPAAK